MSTSKNGTTSRFELPALNLDLGSITDGTDIPPPPKSPVEEPKPAPVENKATNGAQQKSSSSESTPEPEAATKAPNGRNGNFAAGTKRPADDVPLSPVPSRSSRQGSIRRLLSRTRLNNTDTDGTSSNGNGSAASNGNANGPRPSALSNRPSSRSGASSIDDRKSKRSSGWFRRLRGGDGASNASKRSSLIFEHKQDSTTTISKPAGPPPPMIPELKELEKDEGSLGGDLFRNIK